MNEKIQEASRLSSQYLFLDYQNTEIVLNMLENQICKLGLAYCIKTFMCPTEWKSSIIKHSEPKIEDF